MHLYKDPVIADPNIDQSYRLYWSGYLALGYVWKVELCKTVARLSAEVKLQSLVTVNKLCVCVTA